MDEERVLQLLLAAKLKYCCEFVIIVTNFNNMIEIDVRLKSYRILNFCIRIYMYMYIVRSDRFLHNQLALFPGYKFIMIRLNELTCSTCKMQNKAKLIIVTRMHNRINCSSNRSSTCFVHTICCGRI